MRALITGSQGFVGKYLRRELEENGYEVLGIDLQAGPDTIQADLLAPEQMKEVVSQTKPNAVFHLAGQADVARSWKIPQKTMEINVIAAVNLMEAVRAFDPSMRMVLVGSSDQYGNLGEEGRLVSETLETHPQTPYAVSKKAQEEMARVYVRAYGMNICMTRSFNHGGAGQRLGVPHSRLCVRNCKGGAGRGKVAEGGQPYLPPGLHPREGRGPGLPDDCGEGETR